MKLLNSSSQKTPLTSQYRGPHIFNMAGNGEEEEVTPAEGEIPPENGATPEGETPEGGTPPPPEGGEDEDPLKTANPFKEGSSEHDAFERQRAKFAKKLDDAEKRGRETGNSEVVKKLDELITVLGSSARKPEDPAKPEEDPEDVKPTDKDVKIVSNALKQLGWDPQAEIQQRRKAQVKDALTRLKTEYPDIKFDDQDLLKYVNDNNIHRIGGDVYDILETGLLRKNRDAFRKPSTTSSAAPADGVKPPVKKEAVKLQNGSTGKQPAGDTKTKGAGPNAWSSLKSVVLGKYGKKN